MALQNYAADPSPNEPAPSSTSRIPGSATRLNATLTHSGSSAGTDPARNGDVLVMSGWCDSPVLALGQGVGCDDVVGDGAEFQIECVRSRAQEVECGIAVDMAGCHEDSFRLSDDVAGFERDV